jgi:CheY-like chemotaxis protein
MSRPTVLVVDDDRAIREMLRVALEAEGYRVWTLDHGGNVAAKLLSAREPVVVLLDLMMPTCSGWEVCDQLAADPRLSHVPVAVMTAGLLAGDRFPQHARLLLRKPFDLDQVYETVEALARAALPTAAALAG